jgi:hypothetical protein
MKRKNLYLLVFIVTLSLFTGACSGTSNQPSSTTGTASTTGAQNETSLSRVNMLLVGILKLEGTDQAVTTAEAAKLLPLWQAYRSLSSSQTAAEAEVDALLNQIESTMTPEQVQMIKDMNLASSDMVELMQSMGGGMGPQGTPYPRSTPGAGSASGEFQFSNPSDGSAGSPPGGSNGGTTRNFPSGGPPSGGGVMIGPGGDAGSAAGLGGEPMTQGTPDPSMQATAQARFSTQASKVNTILLDVLINKLQSKTSQ